MGRARCDGRCCIKIGQRFGCKYTKAHVSVAPDEISARPRARVLRVYMRLAIYTHCELRQCAFLNKFMIPLGVVRRGKSLAGRMLLGHGRFKKTEIDEAVSDELHSQRNEKQSHEPHENANSRLPHVASYAIGSRQN